RPAGDGISADPAIQPAKKETDPAPEKQAVGLGTVFETRCAVFNVAKPGADNPVMLPYPFKWIPEASAQLNGQVYAFGKYNEARAEGPLKVARFEGKNWAELADLKGPMIRP